MSDSNLKPIKVRRNVNDQRRAPAPVDPTGALDWSAPTEMPPQAPEQPRETPQPPEPAPSTPVRIIGRNKVQPAAVEAPVLQWANGKTVARPLVHRATGRFAPLVGFHIEVGQDPELDAALKAAQVPQIDIKHQRPGGAEIKTHWFLGEEIRFCPLTSGPVAPTVAASVQPRNAQATAEAGIGLRWGVSERSRMALRGYVITLPRAGYRRPVQLSVRSRMSDALFAALLDHVRVAEAADAIVDRARHPNVVELHELALPLAPGQEQEWGKGDTATVVPLVSGHPASIDASYIKTIWRREGVDVAEDWATVVAWAQDYASEDEGEPGQGADVGAGK